MRAMTLFDCGPERILGATAGDPLESHTVCSRKWAVASVLVRSGSQRLFIRRGQLVTVQATHGCAFVATMRPI